MSRAVGRRVPGLVSWAAEVSASTVVLVLRRMSERGGAGFFCPKL
jgi:hypothetical protein